MGFLLVSIITVCSMTMHEGPAECAVSVENTPVPMTMATCQDIARKGAELEMVKILKEDHTRLPTLAQGICVFPEDAPALLNQLPQFFEANDIKHTLRFY